ncbi:polysaccharide deacetylase family protein [Thalassotalea marina]|uniref:Polysaccharide deacetylase n=1 Tax=Thalassotalea marina TaxID=1673741 RepID=A0A919EHA0_9GAMM|nr:polysaccharide deacetylase family protein [Thalassotalea marina]GHF79812.1 polysaccharide deacetylase [Thalassotalea marina]
MKLKLAVSLFVIFCLNQSQAKEIAITFDDSPRHATGYFDGKTRALKLIEQLKQHDVPQVAFFSVSSRLDKEGIERLKLYANAGHVIANHTHNHPNFNQLTLAQYQENFLLADEKLSTFKNYKKWFRFPYLREGDTQEKRDGMRKTLADNGYLNAYITLNNYDWHIESLFQNTIKQGIAIDMQRMSQFYVEQLIDSINYYDELAIKHLGYSPKHVLLLHEMDISALFIGDLVTELRKQGWKIIPVEDAYTDKITDYQTTRIFKFNPGRVGEIARDKGQKKNLWHHSLDEKYLEQKFNQQVLMQ